jgi:cytochrome bd ubiquinol oxidase subunit II
MNAEEALLWTLLASLVAYSVTGGADYGAGVWDLLAFGSRKARQRLVIQEAIAPIWEVNHIWIILLVVLLFSGFPEAFATIAIALHIPIALSLAGMVLRGAAFTFHAYGLRDVKLRSAWGRLFAWSSLLTPIFLGMTLAGISSGAIVLESGRVVSGYTAGWATPFGFFLGVFALTLFALLAATYLAREASTQFPDLAEDFRRRAIGAEAVGGVLAILVSWRASLEAPHLFHNLLNSPWSISVQVVTLLAAAVTTKALMMRRYLAACASAVIQVSSVVLGWGLAMDQHLILPALPVAQAGAIAEVIRPVLWALAMGSVLLVPALWWLFVVFKSSTEEAPPSSRYPD